MSDAWAHNPGFNPCPGQLIDVRLESGHVASCVLSDFYDWPFSDPERGVEGWRRHIVDNHPGLAHVGWLASAGPARPVFYPLNGRLPNGRPMIITPCFVPVGGAK